MLHTYLVLLVNDDVMRTVDMNSLVETNELTEETIALYFTTQDLIYSFFSILVSLSTISDDSSMEDIRNRYTALPFISDTISILNYLISILSQVNFDYDQPWTDLNSSEIFNTSFSLRFVSDISWKTDYSNVNTNGVRLRTPTMKGVVEDCTNAMNSLVYSCLVFIQNSLFSSILHLACLAVEGCQLAFLKNGGLESFLCLLPLQLSYQNVYLILSITQMLIQQGRCLRRESSQTTSPQRFYRPMELKTSCFSFCSTRSIRTRLN